MACADGAAGAELSKLSPFSTWVMGCDLLLNRRLGEWRSRLAGPCLTSPHPDRPARRSGDLAMIPAGRSDAAHSSDFGQSPPAPRSRSWQAPCSFDRTWLLRKTASPFPRAAL